MQVLHYSQYGNDPGAGRPESDLSFLIGDSGQPEFPGWEWIAILLMAATVATLVAGSPFVRGRPMPGRAAAAYSRALKLGSVRAPTLKVAA